MAKPANDKRAPVSFRRGAFAESKAYLLFTVKYTFTESSSQLRDVSNNQAAKAIILFILSSVCLCQLIRHPTAHIRLMELQMKVLSRFAQLRFWEILLT